MFIFSVFDKNPCRYRKGLREIQEARRHKNIRITVRYTGFERLAPFFEEIRKHMAHGLLHP